MVRRWRCQELFTSKSMASEIQKIIRKINYENSQRLVRGEPREIKQEPFIWEPEN